MKTNLELRGESDIDIPALILGVDVAKSKTVQKIHKEAKRKKRKGLIRNYIHSKMLVPCYMVLKDVRREMVKGEQALVLTTLKRHILGIHLSSIRDESREPMSGEMRQNSKKESPTLSEVYKW